MKDSYKILAIVVVVIVIASAFSAIYFLRLGQSSTSSQPVSVTLIGAGSSLVNPLMSDWAFAYTQIQPVDDQKVQVSYSSVGSGQGISDISAKPPLVDFGASDAPLTSTQYSALSATLVTIPESISAVVPAYNLPGIGNGLNFTGSVLAQIFLGNITNWSDPAIQALNPKVNLPNQPIKVVHRSDGSGTMFAFTDYLSQANSEWANTPGLGKNTLPNWPVGVGEKGNEDVAGYIETQQYSLGPLEIAYEVLNKGSISYGTVRNAAGNFILANETYIQDAVQAGASSELPAGDASWTNVSIIDKIYNNATAAHAYPITTFTYVLAYQQQTDKTKGTALVNFLWWIVNHGQAGGVSLGYVPLPANVVAIDDATINSITYNGQPLYTGT
jgi:phosphate transport system substrate-binding protein